MTTSDTLAVVPFMCEVSARLQGNTAGKIAPRRAVKRLPEYLEQAEVNALLQAAPHGKAALLMLLQWRAGLRVSEALALEPSDLSLDTDRPTLRVRRGKGNKPRVVPVHPELQAALRAALSFATLPKDSPLVDVDASTAWRWVQTAYRRAVERGALPPHKQIGTHTLRHSAARHWLSSGIPINTVQRWLGHSRLQTTLLYLEVLPDPLGHMERVP